ncbi:MAG TPA: biotin--[acetyl-CoA-carboxylase] ligase [Anaerolineae bacterium]|nr:biotin--[acetyl-CoA-carboxylase] ligase [Anaerolineae bacterium]
MPPLTEPLSASAIRAALAQAPLIKEVVYAPAVGSTNDVARDLALHAAPHATLVVTDDQTAGRGRLNRTWYMPPCAALAFSILVRPDLAALHANRLTMLAGLAAAEGIEQATGLAIHLKWPNDVIVMKHEESSMKKVGGILTESSISGEQIDYAVVGIGLNVNVDFADQPELAETATSLWLELSHPVDRLKVLAAVVACFAARFEWLSADAALRAAWSTRLITLGHRVEAHTPAGALAGLAQAVDDDGALLLRTDDGRLHRLLAADVTLQA